MREDHSERDRAVWQRIFGAVPTSWFEAPPSDAMKQCGAFFGRNPCERLLDLACGFGRWTLFLAGHGPSKIVGVDYAENGIRAASAWACRASTDANFLVATATSLPFRRATFDGVLAALLLDNLSRADLGRALREINYVTHPGARGFFVFNPYFTEADASEVSDDNPTKTCLHVAYTDDELMAVLPGWAITRTRVSAERFRVVEGIYRPGQEGESSRSQTR